MRSKTILNSQAKPPITVCMEFAPLEGKMTLRARVNSGWLLQLSRRGAMRFGYVSHAARLPLDSMECICLSENAIAHNPGNNYEYVFIRGSMEEALADGLLIRAYIDYAGLHLFLADSYACPLEHTIKLLTLNPRGILVREPIPTECGIERAGDGKIAVCTDRW
jgi:hypothetical protein